MKGVEPKPGDGDAKKSRLIPAVVMLLFSIVLVIAGLSWSLKALADSLYGIYFHIVPILLVLLGLLAGYSSYQMFRNKD